MTRSVWKGPFSEIWLRKRKVWSRRSMILPKDVYQEFKIHNGKTHLSLQISEEMIGHKFGEFAMTRKKATHKRKVHKWKR